MKFKKKKKIIIIIHSETLQEPELGFLLKDQTGFQFLNHLLCIKSESYTVVIKTMTTLIVNTNNFCLSTILM